MMTPCIFPLTTPALVGYVAIVTEKSVTCFSRQTQGGHSPATNLLIGGFFASAVWLCSFWASRAGELKGSPVPRVRSSKPASTRPFFVWKRKMGGKPSPTTRGVQP